MEEQSEIVRSKKEFAFERIRLCIQHYTIPSWSRNHCRPHRWNYRRILSFLN